MGTFDTLKEYHEAIDKKEEELKLLVGAFAFNIASRLTMGEVRSAMEDASTGISSIKHLFDDEFPHG